MLEMVIPARRSLVVSMLARMVLAFVPKVLAEWWVTRGTQLKVVYRALTISGHQRAQ